MLFKRGFDDRVYAGDRLCCQHFEIRFAYCIGALPRIGSKKSGVTIIGGNQSGDRGFIAFECLTRLSIFTRYRNIGDFDILVIDLGILFQPVVVTDKIGLGFERQIIRHSGKILVPARICGEVDRALAKAVALDNAAQCPTKYPRLYFAWCIQLILWDCI